MPFTHDTAEALDAAAWLVNSRQEPDTLTSIEQLAAFFDRFGYTGSRPTLADLEPVRAARPALRSLLTSERDAAVPLVNAILADARALPRLVRHGELDWHIHATSDDRPLAERVLVETAMAMIDVIREDETSRLATCASDGCEGVVFDQSRNRSRKYCSIACTNREAAAAYRARASAADEAPGEGGA
jgi:predicted RNA-binding Zn ribbon-like protein